jgi:hypothetical protein
LRGKRHLFKGPSKRKLRRCLTSFDMTINGGGKSPLLQLYPKRKTEEISRFSRDDKLVGFLSFSGVSCEGDTPSQYGRSFASLRMTGYENRFCLWGKVGKGAKPSFQNVSLRADFARSLLFSPFCHPERNEGSPPSNGESTPALSKKEL